MCLIWQTVVILSFYTYSNCFENETVLSSFESIMAATEKHCSYLNNIARSDSLKEKYIKEIFEEGEAPNDIIENEIDIDIAYSLYYRLFMKTNETTDDYYNRLKKKLAKQYRKNQLDTLYEKRAYRVLNNLTKQDVKKLDKELEKQIEFLKRTGF